MESYAVSISSDASSLSSVTSIPANVSKCRGNVCEYELKVSPDTMCPSSSEFDDVSTIMISALAENRLGPGLPTDMIPIGKYSSYDHLLQMCVCVTAYECVCMCVCTCHVYACCLQSYNTIIIPHEC